MVLTFGEGDLARSCVGTQLLIRSGAGLMDFDVITYIEQEGRVMDQL